MIYLITEKYQIKVDLLRRHQFIPAVYEILDGRNIDFELACFDIEFCKKIEHHPERFCALVVTGNDLFDSCGEVIGIADGEYRDTDAIGVLESVFV